LFSIAARPGRLSRKTRPFLRRKVKIFLIFENFFEIFT
jgi:hypothetical protein